MPNFLAALNNGPSRTHDSHVHCDGQFAEGNNPTWVYSHFLPAIPIKCFFIEAPLTDGLTSAPPYEDLSIPHYQSFA